MLDFILNTLGQSMARKARPEDIRRYIRQKGMRKQDQVQPINPHRVRVAVVQEKIAVLKTYRAFADRMYAFVQQAVDQGAQIVCFPEENGLLLLGQFPLIDWILPYASRQMVGAEGQHLDTPADNLLPSAHIGMPEAPVNEAHNGLSVAHLLSFFSPFMKAAFEATFSELARGFGIYIMAGSLMLVENGRLYNRAYLYAPDGSLVGTQDKAHPIEMEIDMGLACGEEIKVFDTQVGRLAFPVCMDATYFETFKIARHLGARMVIIPIANLEPYDYYYTLRGIWPRVQESGLYGLKSALVGNLYGFCFTGKAGVYAPLELTPDGSGVVAEAETYDQDAVVTADLDLPRLDSYTSDYFGDSNPALYRKYFPQIYSSNG